MHAQAQPQQPTLTPALTLDQARPGHYRVQRLDCTHGMRLRLAAMGLRRDTGLQLLFKNRTGGVILVGDTRLALGHELLKAIRVEPA